MTLTFEQGKRLMCYEINQEGFKLWIENFQNKLPPEIWVDVKTIAEIKGITPRGLRLALKKGRYTYREVQSQGGSSYEILLSSIEPKVQEIYKNTYYREIVELEAQQEIIPISKPVKTESGFIPETAKTIALARVDLIGEWQKFRENHKPRQNGDKVFIDLYNSGEYLKNIFDKLGKTSRGSLQRWLRLYNEEKDWEALVPQYNTLDLTIIARYFPKKK